MPLARGFVARSDITDNAVALTAFAEWDGMSISITIG
jgi:hypothetical protein